MTEHRDIATIEVDLKVAAKERDDAFDRMIELKNELNAAKLAAASHPWVGKTVKRQELRGYGSNRKLYTLRGTVALYDPKLHRRLRSLSTYNLEPGDPIVVHANGNSGWTLMSIDWSTRTTTNLWKVVE